MKYSGRVKKKCRDKIISKGREEKKNAKTTPT